jgi:hypothetical protein
VGAEEIFGGLFEGLKQVGDLGLDVGKAVVDIPMALVSAIPEFTKDPEVFMRGGRADPGALLSRDYRTRKKADLTAAREFEKMQQTASAMDWVNSLFGPTSGMSPAESKEFAISQGASPAMAEAAQRRDYVMSQDEAANRAAALASGQLPEVARIADRHSAQQAGQTRFASDRQIQEIGAQGAETRRNQGNQFGLSKALTSLRHQNRLAEIGAGSAGQPAGAEAGGLPIKTSSERNGLRNLKDLRIRLKKGLIPEQLKNDAQAILKSKNGQQAYNMLTGLSHTDRPMGAREILKDPSYRDAAERARAAKAAIAGVAAVEEAAFTPDRSGVDPSLFSPALSLMLPDSAATQSVALGLLDEQTGARKQNLISTAAKNVGDYVLRMTGKVSNQNELERLKTVAPTGNEASGLLFQTKAMAFKRALEREAEIAEAETEAIGSGMVAGDWRFRSEYDANLRQLNEDLAEAEQDASNQPDGPLTPEELAEMEKYRANR